jgi:hypothetical protein
MAGSSRFRTAPHLGAIAARSRHLGIVSRLRLLAVLWLLSSVIAGCAADVTELHPSHVGDETASPPVQKFSRADEVAGLRDALSHAVPSSPHFARDDEVWTSRARAALFASGFRIDRPQLMVVVDRAPRIQQMVIVLADANLAWQVIGAAKISTGQPGRRGYFITPTGVFRHDSGILDYRALGTFNDKHIRGLGVRGMRVWDFGWHKAAKGWVQQPEDGEIRLLMHATDPDVLEQRLGRPASMGCIRIPAAMNIFLDVHGVLDADYERAAHTDPRFRSVLRPDRQPTPLAGDILVVIDSSETH